MMQKISESPAGKAGLVVVVLAAIGIAVYAFISSSNVAGGGYGKQVSAKDAAVKAQQAIDALRVNDKLPPQVKQQEIAHLQAQVDAGNGHPAAAAKPPTPGG